VLIKEEVADAAEGGREATDAADPAGLRTSDEPEGRRIKEEGRDAAR
jgi:hypothetical protein